MTGRVRLTITERLAFAGGMPFGGTGPYEMLIGRAHYAVDPHAAGQRAITDIGHAPVGPEGLVRFAGDVAILRPADLRRGNRRLFFDWGNRGAKKALVYFNDAPAANDPRTAAHAGNGFLMRRGYSIVWGAWQGDLLPGNGRMLLDLPVAAGADGRPLTGLVRVEFPGRAGVDCYPLSGWVSTRSHPAVSLDTREARLTRRRYPNDPRLPVPPEAWSFARREGGQGLETMGADHAIVPSRRHVHLPGGFEPGWIHELVYVGEAPLVLGLGHAAVRDLVSFLRHDATEANPLFDPAARVERAYGFGRSQTGRAIRDFIHKGFNEDAAGRRVFDGLMPHVAGAGMLATHRFAHLTVPAGQEYEDHFNAADRFPFSYAESTDHLTGRRDAILRRPATDPLVMHTQSATEYWQRRGSLVHTTTDGRDLEQPETVRVHLWSSSQHMADPNLQRPSRGVCQSEENVVATTALFRAALDALDAWATHGAAPPPGRVPRRADGTLVTMPEWRAGFPAIPGIAAPRGPSALPLLDFGEAPPGVHMREPPAVAPGEGYAVLVPALDGDGNDIAGVRAPMVAAPLATYTGWNIRGRGHGQGAMHEFTGSTIPLPDTPEERAATGDPRASVLERYPDKAAYVAAIEAAARRLVAERLMLEEDLPRAVALAADWGRPRHSVLLP